MLGKILTYIFVAIAIISFSNISIAETLLLNTEESLNRGELVKITTSLADRTVTKVASTSDVVFGVVRDSVTYVATPVPVKIVTGALVNVKVTDGTPIAGEWLIPSATGAATSSATRDDYSFARVVKDAFQESTIWYVQAYMGKGAEGASGGGGGGSITFQEDDTGTDTFTTMDVQKGFSGTVVAGELDLSLDVDEVAGIGTNGLVFWSTLDNYGASAPPLLFPNGDSAAASASGIKWLISHRFDNDAYTGGTDLGSPTAGTALPSGVTGVGDRLSFGGGASTNNFLNGLTKPTFSVLAVEDFFWGLAFNSPAVTGSEWLFDTDASSGNGMSAHISPTTTQLRLRISTLYYGESAGDLDDGADHAIAAVWDQTNRTIWADGTQAAQSAKSRTGTLSHGTTVGMSIGGFSTSTGNIYAGDLLANCMYKVTSTGTISKDLGEWWSGNWPNSELIGSRSVKGKFGEGRLYVGTDYETYSSDTVRPLRSGGTMSMWYQPIYDATSTTITSTPTLFEIPAAGSELWGLYYDPTPDTFTAKIISGSGTVTAASSAQTFNDGTWIHLAMTWDSTNLKLYVNGVIAATAALGSEPHPTGELQTTWTLGNDHATKLKSAQGVIDHLKADDRAWTAAEVAKEAAATRPF